jgi:hypothetical protein
MNRTYVFFDSSRAYSPRVTSFFRMRVSTTNTMMADAMVALVQK